VLNTDRGDTVEIGGAYLNAGHVHHAYALTGHRAQGITVDRAFVLATGDGRTQEWGYVALSRAREQTRVYITDQQREPESHFHELDDRPATTRVAQALETSATENLATNQQLPVERWASRAHIERLGPDVTGTAQKSRVDLAHRSREQRTEDTLARARSGRSTGTGIEL
jgi:hypothetical protein